MNKQKAENPTPGSDADATAPASRPDQPSPPERHPGLKPEEADGDFEDLEVREKGNRR